MRVEVRSVALFWAGGAIDRAQVKNSTARRGRRGPFFGARREDLRRRCGGAPPWETPLDIARC